MTQVNAIKVRNEARISVNKLGEYLGATPSKRHKLLNDQKRPAAFKAPYYQEAERPIVDYLTSKINIDSLVDTARKLLERSPGSDWDEHRNPNCADAILHLAKIKQTDALMEFEREAGQRTNGKIMISGLPVSVRPEVILKGKDRSGNPVYGAIKLNISGSLTLNGQVGTHPVGEYVATTVHQYMEQYLADNGMEGKAKPGMCYVVDVFARQVYQAPNNCRSMRKDIAAACDEIKNQWPHI